jgi:hypothetical protein
MTNEEKAKRTYPYFEDMNDIEIVQTNAKRLGFIAGCEWKDVQLEAERQALIDKACEWWESELTYPTMTQADIDDFVLGRIKEFKQAMKGGEE